jgi:hypothetical protein
MLRDPQPGIVPRIRADRNYRVPDFGVTRAAPSLGRMVPEPAPLVEMLSPSNEAETRANIWAYTTIPSVHELVVVHSTRIEAEDFAEARRAAGRSSPR